MSVRLAIGQVLDYGRFVDGSRLAVLLPEEPHAADLVELLVFKRPVLDQWQVR